MPSTLQQLKLQDEGADFVHGGASDLDRYFDAFVAVQFEVGGTPEEVFNLLWSLENGNLLLKSEAERYVTRYLYSDAT